MPSTVIGPLATTIAPVVVSSAPTGGGDRTPAARASPARTPAPVPPPPPGGRGGPGGAAAAEPRPQAGERAGALHAVPALLALARDGQVRLPGQLLPGVLGGGAAAAAADRHVEVGHGVERRAARRAGG